MSEPKYEYRMPSGMVLQSIDADDEPHEADFTTFSKAALAARDAATRRAALREAADAIRAGGCLDSTQCTCCTDAARVVERLIESA